MNISEVNRPVLEPSPSLGAANLNNVVDLLVDA